jgi:hypothetical protein
MLSSRTILLKILNLYWMKQVASTPIAAGDPNTYSNNVIDGNIVLDGIGAVGGKDQYKGGCTRNPH